MSQYLLFETSFILLFGSFFSMCGTSWTVFTKMFIYDLSRASFHDIL